MALLFGGGSQPTENIAYTFAAKGMNKGLRPFKTVQLLKMG
jgi:hypothetical protein